METFAVDKCFYDIGASDLKEFWDADLDPVSSNDITRDLNAVFTFGFPLKHVLYIFFCY